MPIESAEASIGMQSLPHAPISPLAPATSESHRTTGSSRPSHGTKPSSSSLSSPQKIKKRVPWRGRTCIISLPGPLSRADFKEYEYRDARIDPPNPEARTRPSFPDPEDIRAERTVRLFRIRIPDKIQWDLYVKDLKEAKLRALGVSSMEESQIQGPPVAAPLTRHPASHASSLPVSPCFAPPHSTGTSLRHAYGVPFNFQNAPSSSSRVSPTLVLDSKSRIEPSVRHFPRYSVSNPQGSPDLLLPNGFLPSASPNTNVGQKYHTSTQTSSRITSPFHDGVLPGFSATSNAELLAMHQSNNAFLPHNGENQATLRGQQKVIGESQSQPSRQDYSHPHHPGSPSLSTNLQQSGSQWIWNTGISNPAIQNPIPRSHRASVPEALERRLCQAEGIKEITRGSVREGDLARQKDSTPRISKIDSTESPKVLNNFEFKGPSMHPKQGCAAAPLTPGLNALAPEFKVGSANIPPISSSAGTATRPTAPAFTPTSMPQQFPVLAKFTFLSAGPVFQPTTNIVKPDKGSKAVQIKEPKDEWSISAPEGEVQEDESGRITQADGRQKRQRRISEDGDQDARFASPAHAPSSPFDQHPEKDHWTPSLSKTLHTRQESESLGKATQAANQLKEIIDEISTSENPSSQGETAQSADPDERVFTFHDVTEAIAFDAARPRSPSANVEAPQRSLAGHATPADEMLATCGSVTKDVSSPPVYNSIKDGVGSRLAGTPARSKVSDRELPTPQPKPEPSDPSTSEERLQGQSRPRMISKSNNVETCNGHGSTGDVVDGVSYIDPSFEEIDAVIKQLNDEDPGQNMNAKEEPLEAHNSHRISTHDFQDSKVMPILYKHNDAQISGLDDGPSRAYQYLPPTESESVNSSVVGLVANNARFSPSYRPSHASEAGQLPSHDLGSAESAAISEWDKALSPSEGTVSDDEYAPLEARVENVVSNVLENRLMPLENSLFAIQSSWLALSKNLSSQSEQPKPQGEAEISDADDEDDIDGSRPVTKPPDKDRKMDKLKAMISEVLASQHNVIPASELGNIAESIKELKALLRETGPPSTDVKTAVEEAIGRQMRGRSIPVTSSHQSATMEKSQLQIAGLESMLKIAEGRAEDEMKARRATEDALADSQRLLRLALQDAAEQRESAEETEQSLSAFHKERHELLRHNALLEGAQENFQRTASELTEKNLALEGTLEEYRLSSSQWREEIESAKVENKDLRRTMNALRTEMEDGISGRQALGAKFDHLQEELALASQNIARDQSLWRIKEEEHGVKCELLVADGEQQSQKQGRMEAEVAALSQKLLTSKEEHHQVTTQLERQLHDQQERARLERDRMQNIIEEEIKATTNKMDNIRMHSDQVAASLRSQLHQATTVANTERARFEQLLQEAAASSTAALEERQAFHDQVARSLREQHELLSLSAMKEQQHIELQCRDRVDIAEEKLSLYQEKVQLLEEKLEVAKSAAKAAVQAVQSSRSASDAQLHRDSFVSGSVSDPPAKTSPQALRESILVLQEQLQDRESQIEQLQQKLAAVDTEAPIKVKVQETEITWLRELLGVRIDDLEDLITAAGQPVYDRETVKDAAIRLKANIEMEQQVKERAQSEGQSFPSLASISNLTSSPRSLPLAAAAAWGNWRKGRNAPASNLFGGANGHVAETPLRSSPSTQSIMSGLMTPPHTDMRGEHQSGGNSRTLMPPSSRKRPMARTPRQSLPHAGGDRPLQGPSPPITPSLTRRANYDMDAESTDVDGLYNTVAGPGEDVGPAEEEEPFGPRTAASPGHP
ncbi:MAG: hypothetical protein Q9166_004460 [cf. Caloplaca sp. 2 TL-2023]